MTREEVKKRAKWELDYDANKGRFNSSCNVMEYIDLIFDDIENRICDNCKFYEFDKWEEDKGTCRRKGQMFNVMTNRNFGCNRFENKGIEND